MEIPTQIKQLDRFLLMFDLKSEKKGYNRIDINNLLKKHDIHIKLLELDEILFKLVKDGYLRVETDKAQMLNVGMIADVSYWMLTFEGELFQQQGGYTRELEDINASNRANYIRTLILTYGTAAAGAYGLFEILKWVFHHEHWRIFF